LKLANIHEFDMLMCNYKYVRMLLIDDFGKGSTTAADINCVFEIIVEKCLASRRLKGLISQAKDEYDYVLIDAPPVVVVTDAALLSSICDGVVLVIGSGETIEEAAVKARDLLLNVKANIIGVVLNK
jgi:DNA replication protein DnaC